MINKIKEAYIKYIDEKYSARSSKPANIMHDAIKARIEALIDINDQFEVRTSNHGGEFKFTSPIHEKRIDITVIDVSSKRHIPVVAVSFKLPLMSVNKNLKNYFEMNIGDATLVKSSGTPFYYFMVLDNNSLKNEKGKVTFDEISDRSIMSFSKVMQAEYYSQFRPNYTFITKVDFGDREYKAGKIGTPISNWKKVSENHIDCVSPIDPSAQVFLANGEWSENFDEYLDMFFSSIKLDIELYKIRKRG